MPQTAKDKKIQIELKKLQGEHSSLRDIALKTRDTATVLTMASKGVEIENLKNKLYGKNTRLSIVVSKTQKDPSKLTPDHTIAIFDEKFNLFEYDHDVLPLKTTSFKTDQDFTNDKTRVPAYLFNSSVVGEDKLKEVAVLARKKKLLPNTKVETLIKTARFDAHEERNQPVEIILKNTTFFVAPRAN